MSPSPSESRAIKARILGRSIVNLAVDVIAPTIIAVALTAAGMQAYLALAASGVVIAGKANLGPIEDWRLDRQAAATVACTVVGLAALFTLVALGAPRGIAACAALVIAAIPVLISLIGQRQRIDGIALLVLAELIASVVVTLASNDPRFILARPAIYTAVAGVYVLSTVRSGRPLLLDASKPMAAGGDPARADAFESAWEHSPRFRRFQRAGTAGFGIILLIEAVLRVVIVYASKNASVAVSGITSQAPGIALFVVFILGYRALAVPRLSKIVDTYQNAAKANPQADEANDDPTVPVTSVTQNATGRMRAETQASANSA